MFIKNGFKCSYLFAILRKASEGVTYLSRLPWIFPGAPLKTNGNFQGNLISMSQIICRHNTDITLMNNLRSWEWHCANNNVLVRKTWLFHENSVSKTGVWLPIILSKLIVYMTPIVCYQSLQWCHNERDGISNHRRFDGLLSRLNADQRKH